MHTKLREKLKVGLFSGLYQSLRGVKRKFRGEPHTGVLPIELNPLTHDELKPHFHANPTSARIAFSIALQLLRRSEPAERFASWNFLFVALKLDFESPERIAVYAAQLLSSFGHHEEALSLVKPFESFEFTETENALLHKVREGGFSSPDVIKFPGGEECLHDFQCALKSRYRPQPEIKLSNSPKVSVILPNYNYARYLKERIRSVLKQTYTDFELLYLDDASKDESNEVAKEFCSDPRFKMTCFTENSGKVYQRWNDGAALAKGEWLWFAGADDSADPKFLETLLSLAEKHPTAAIIHCQIGTIDSDGAIVGMRFAAIPEAEVRFQTDYFAPGNEETMRLAIGCIFTTASAMLIRRDVFEKLGGFDTRLWQAADWDFYLSVMKTNDVAYCAMPLAQYRAHQTTVSKNTKALVRALENAYCVAKAYEWVKEDPRFSSEERDEMLRRIKLSAFELYADPDAVVPENLKFACETVYRVLPDERLKKLMK